MDPTAWLEDNAYGFRELAEADRKAINHFALLWGLFEQRVLYTTGSAGAIVDATAGMATDGRLDTARLADAYAYFRGRYFRDNDFTHHYDGLRLRGKSDREDLVKSVLTGTTNEPAEIAAGVLIIIYRFRNNLHHGLKWAYGLQGQRENFERSNAVLMAIMEMWGPSRE